MNNTELELKQLELLEEDPRIIKAKKKVKSESTKRVSLRQFFIDSFVKESIFMEYIPFELKSNFELDKVKHQ